MLHSRQWREKFADDLTKSAARIPMTATAADFRAFADAGRELAELHVNYETVEPYPLLETHGPDWDPDAPNAYRVEKMAYAGPARNPDRTAIVCNTHITLSGIPQQAHEYHLGSRSALDWLIDRYQVKTDSKSGITNDPNDWAKEHGQSRYIIDLVKRVTTVSVRTVEIVNGTYRTCGLIDGAELPAGTPETFRQLADRVGRGDDTSVQLSSDCPTSSASGNSGHGHLRGAIDTEAPQRPRRALVLHAARHHSRRPSAAARPGVTSRQ